MLRTTLKNLSARKLRLLTTGVAVMLGIAFMAGTLVLTATIDRAFDGLFADANAGTDAVVRSADTIGTGDTESRSRIDASVVDAVRGIDGVDAAEPHIQTYAQLIDHDGEPMGNPRMGAPVLGGAWESDERLNPFAIDEGRAPVSGTEVVVDRHSAETGHLAVGDQVTVLTQAGPVDAHLVGIGTYAGLDSPGGASITLFTPEAAQRYLTEPGRIDAVRVAAVDGVDQAELVQRLEAQLPDGLEALTGAELTAEQQQEMADTMGFLNAFLVTFAVIALFVGSFIIYNSFSILVAQRSREMALLRAIGANRRQVLGSVLLEAVAVGLIASAAGLVAGVGLAQGLRALLTGMGIDLPAGGVVLTTSTVVVSLVAGIGVSVASAVLPARRAAKIPPIAALRDLAVEPGRSGRRFAIGAVVTGAGAAALAAGLFGGAGAAAVGLGALLVFAGVVVLGPVLAVPIATVLGAPLARLRGVSGALARQNAIRNPKRTASTASALMIGVALVSVITVMASSTKASIDEVVERTFQGDLVVESGAFDQGGLSPDLAARIARLPEVAAVSGLRVAPAEVDGSPTMLTSVDPATVGQVMDLGVVDGTVTGAGGLGDHQIAVAADVAEAKGWTVGDEVDVRFAATGDQPLTVAATYDEDDTVGAYLVGHPTFEANVADQFDAKVMVRLADGVSLSQGREAVTAVADTNPLAEVQDRDQYRSAMGAKVDTMLGLVYALLALAVVIAFLGIVNTLALSILERTRELGLLRAVGMSRSQLRSTVRYESVIIALLGTTLGIVVGVGFGWALVTSLADVGLGTFALPVAQLGAVAAVAALAGVAAAVVPARRAARLDVLDAITH